MSRALGGTPRTLRSATPLSHAGRGTGSFASRYYYRFALDERWCKAMDGIKTSTLLLVGVGPLTNHCWVPPSWATSFHTRHQGALSGLRCSWASGGPQSPARRCTTFHACHRGYIINVTSTVHVAAIFLFILSYEGYIQNRIYITQVTGGVRGRCGG